MDGDRCPAATDESLDGAVLVDAVVGFDVDGDGAGKRCEANVAGHAVSPFW